MTMQGSSKNNSAGEKMEGRVSKELGEFNIKQADVSNVSPSLERMTTGEKVEIQEERGYYLRSLIELKVHLRRLNHAARHIQTAKALGTILLLGTSFPQIACSTWRKTCELKRRFSLQSLALLNKILGNNG